MNRYVYVVAYEGEEDDDPISFEHAFVEAENEDLAYSEGHKALPTQRHERPLNDYVVTLSDAIFMTKDKESKENDKEAVDRGLHLVRGLHVGRPAALLPANDAHHQKPGW